MVGFAHVDTWHILTYSTMYICRQGYGVIDLQCVGTYILYLLMTYPLVPQNSDMVGSILILVARLP